MIAPLRHPAAARQAAGDARPAERGAPGRAAHRELARAGVRGARRAVPPARRDPRRAARGDGGGLARHAGRLRGPALPLRRRLPRAEALPAGGAAHVVRRAVAAPGAAAAPRPLRRTASTRSARRRRRARAAASRDGGRPAATSASSRWSAASAGRSPTRRASADLAQAAEAIPAQLAQGYTSICFKPSMFTDDLGAGRAALPRPRRARRGAASPTAQRRAPPARRVAWMRGVRLGLGCDA